MGFLHLHYRPPEVVGETRDGRKKYRLPDGRLLVETPTFPDEAARSFRNWLPEQAESMPRAAFEETCLRAGIAVPGDETYRLLAGPRGKARAGGGFSGRSSSVIRKRRQGISG